MKKKKGMFNALSKMRQIFEEVDTETTDYVEVKTEDGKILRMDILALEEVVVEITEDGEIEVADNDYVLEDGRTLVIESNKIVEILEKEEGEDEEDKESEGESEEKFAEITSVYKWTLNVTAENIEVGTEIKEVTEDGTEYSVAAVEYELEDGRTMQVDAESIVILISDKDGDVESVIENTEDHTGEVEVKPSENESESEEFSALLIKEMKSMVEQFNELKSEIRSVKSENRKMRSSMNKFNKQASAKHTDTKLKFSQKSTTPKSVLNSMRGK